MSKVRALRTLVLFTAASMVGACTVHQSAPPGLTGPSDFAVSLNVVASPDSIFQDGGSQSTIRVTAKGPDGKAYAGLSLRMDMQLNGVAQDFGTLSARNIVTGGDGTATVLYTAPPPAPGNTGTCSTVPGTCVTILATAVGFDFAGAVPRSTEVRLIPVGVILPPADDPTPAFTLSPASPPANSPVAFDASASCGGKADTSGNCLPTVSPIASWSWTFGDGGTGSGRSITHTYSTPGPYNVTLTVTNDRGFAKSLTKQVTVLPGVAPLADFVFSPSNPEINQSVLFDATLSKPAPGHTIVSYSWNFGDNGTANGAVASHTYSAVGVYNVTLTVKDEAGQPTTVSKPITVGNPASTPPTASFVFTPQPVVVNADVFFDASASRATPGHTIRTYQWNFGDGTPIDTRTTPLNTHKFTTTGVYTVVLTVTDEIGQQGTVSQNIAVGTGAPVAIFTVTVINANTHSIQADGSASIAIGGATIVSYTYAWGDGFTTTGSAIQTHGYASAGTYTVRLTVLDSLGRTGSATQNVNVP